MSLSIRAANAADAETILAFITELAVYEKAEHEVLANIADIERTLLDPNSPAKALICLNNDQPVGFALYFLSYSTWLGRPGLYLEDLYVAPQQRGLGAGKKLLQHLARIAVENDCGRFEWSVLDWNEPAIRFYEAIGAKAQPEWVRYRLAGDDLRQFAETG
ncbi:GNAT family N-acetyltransferase [Pseudomonas sp. nanlin1]|uniref:GNAT family N-acetyltransferase n=1 Tax=Pseudomonas sp. nanlin1 TaxID=3040605 RepID=UPI00388F10EB